MMGRRHQEEDSRVKKRTMGLKGYVMAYGTMLLFVGIQTGIIVLPAFGQWHPFTQVAVIMGYWAILAALFSYITNHQIKQSYDKPMRRLSKAAKQVAGGDFSVYVEPTHTSDNYDYLDIMLLDFNVMVQELGSIETMKNDFIANVSHEIKTPLAVIKNYTTALKDESLSPDERAHYMDTIIFATTNLSTLVSNILRLNKLDNQQIAPPMEPYDLCRQLCDCVLFFEPLWEKKQIEIHMDIEEVATIYANRDMLDMVWNNLLSNALKFTPDGGEITLSQTSDAEMITVSVIDTGCGMDQEMLKHIFDKFYQGDTSHSGEGNGLGLAIARLAAEKMGGTLTAKSEPGKGSTFAVMLPINC